jgi:(E)-4-hydroxy-3-methyl-but-2-enyl pyrophosphate reductase
MKIVIAQTAGFCMGVRRAVEMVLEAPDKHQGPICTYGPLIHNPQVLDLLTAKGIGVLRRIPHRGTGTALIRAHGVPPAVKSDLARSGFAVIDATCPRVIRVQTIIRKHAAKGYASIIIGDRDHPEVVGLLGYAGGMGHVAATLQELEQLPPFPQAIVVAQTTQNTRLFEAVKAWVRQHRPHYKIFETICDSTEKRQAEVECLAALVDAVVVVGGRDSGNTQRLFEIARSSGKPAYHVETEDDLDLAALARLQRVGVTAGASTPNWQIRKVCRALAAAPFQSGHGWRSKLYHLQQALILTNIYVAIGAGCLSYAAANLQGLQGLLSPAVVAVLYVLSMHILNHLTGSDADHYNDPERERFYHRNQWRLAVLAVLGGAGGLAISATAGPAAFSVLLVMSLLGLSYNRRVLPAWLSRGRYERIRDIPGSKTFLIAAAWGLATAVLPALTAHRLHPTTLLVWLWTSGIVFARTAFFDLLDVQGDRLVGRETIPVVLGEKRTLDLLKLNLLGMFLLLLVLTAFGWVTPLGYLLLGVPATMTIVVLAHERGWMLPGAGLEFLMESHFILAGLLSLLWVWWR